MDESITRHLDAPPKVLKLSEAIRIGAKIRPQSFGYLWGDGTSCALGAAAEGIGFAYGENITRGDLWAAFPKTKEPAEFLHQRIIEWNDSERMTREAIADRLEAMGY